MNEWWIDEWMKAKGIKLKERIGLRDLKSIQDNIEKLKKEPSDELFAETENALKRFQEGDMERLRCKIKRRKRKNKKRKPVVVECVEEGKLYEKGTEKAKEFSDLKAQRKRLLHLKKRVELLDELRKTRSNGPIESLLKAKLLINQHLSHVTIKLSTFHNFWEQANQDLACLLRIRKSWDAHLSENGTSIPPFFPFPPQNAWL